MVRSSLEKSHLLSISPYVNEAYRQARTQLTTESPRMNSNQIYRQKKFRCPDALSLRINLTKEVQSASDPRATPLLFDLQTSAQRHLDVQVTREVLTSVLNASFHPTNDSPTVRSQRVISATRALLLSGLPCNRDLAEGGEVPT